MRSVMLRFYLLPPEHRVVVTNLPPKSHLLLGITEEGMMLFLKQISFFDVGEPNALEARGGKPANRYWGKYSVYERKEDVAWVTKLYGSILQEQGSDGVKIDSSRPLADVPGFHTHMTGYDLCSVLRHLLSSTGHAERSVCEMILADEAYAHLRVHVGPANVFWSHTQRYGIHETLGKMMTGCDTHAASLPQPASARRFWLDYFCLRQCLPDFDVMKTRALIRQIGKFMVEIDKPVVYMTRSFCILETFAAVEAAATFMCVSPWWQDGMQFLLEQAPVDSASASTWHTEDKEKIDTFIRETVGFDDFDSIVTNAIIDGAVPSPHPGTLGRGQPLAMHQAHGFESKGPGNVIGRGRGRGNPIQL